MPITVIFPIFFSYHSSWHLPQNLSIIFISSTFLMATFLMATLPSLRLIKLIPPLKLFPLTSSTLIDSSSIPPSLPLLSHFQKSIFCLSGFHYRYVWETDGILSVVLKNCSFVLIPCQGKQICFVC